MPDTQQRSGAAATDGGARGAIGVLLCDDMPDLRELTRYGLEQDLRLQVLGEAGSAAECFEAVEELDPDALLLDLTLPDMDGLDAIPRLRQLAPDLSIVVFSGLDAGRMEGRALARGADAYVEKGTSLGEIRKAVLAAARGRGHEVGPSVPLELRAHGGRGSRAAQPLAAEVFASLDEIDSFMDLLDDASLDEAVRRRLGGARDALAALRRLLGERLH